MSLTVKSIFVSVCLSLSVHVQLSIIAAGSSPSIRSFARASTILPPSGKASTGGITLIVDFGGAGESVGLGILRQSQIHPRGRGTCQVTFVLLLWWRFLCFLIVFACQILRKTPQTCQMDLLPSQGVFGGYLEGIWGVKATKKQTKTTQQTFH